MGTHTLTGCAGQIDHHHFRCGHIVCILQQLLDDLGAAFTHAHGAQGTVAGVAVAAQHHTAAAAEHFAGKLVDDCLVGGHIDAAVSLGGGQAEDMVVLIDGAAHGTQAVVAVGQHIGYRETLQTGGARRLDNAHIGNVVGDQTVKADAHLIRRAALIVGAQDLIGNRLFAAGLLAVLQRRYRTAAPDNGICM